jgi:DNA mismatch repair protein MSH4
MLKQFVGSVEPIYEALTGARSSMLNNIREVEFGDLIVLTVR